MRALIIGIDGTIGAALARALRQRGDIVYGTYRRRVTASENTTFFDLADKTARAEDLPVCDVAFLCAAMTRLADCRARPELAARVNAQAPVRLAKLLTAQGSRVVFLSTSAVFDCLEPHMRADRPRQPSSVYGRGKAAAEDGLLALGEQVSILRLTKVLTPETALLKQWYRAGAAGEAITAFGDHRIAPIPLCSAIDTLRSIGHFGEGGIYQISGAKDVSYADIARYVTRRVGGNESLVDAIAASAGGLAPEEVFPYTSLDTSRLAALVGFEAPDPYAVLDTVLETWT